MPNSASWRGLCLAGPVPLVRLGWPQACAVPKRVVAVSVHPVAGDLLHLAERGHCEDKIRIITEHARILKFDQSDVE
jgi:hypothetical protein